MRSGGFEWSRDPTTEKIHRRGLQVTRVQISRETVYGSGASSFRISLHNGAGSEITHILIIVGPSGPPNGSGLFQKADAKRASSASIKPFLEIFEHE